MQGLISWWAKNGVAANLLMVAITIAGLLSYQSIDREVLPTVAIPLVTVNVSWLGADPQEIEEQIILRLEEAIYEVDGVKHVDSRANEGFANVQVEADPEIDLNAFVNDIKNQVDGISTFPEEAFDPVVQKIVGSSRTHLIAISGSVSPMELNRIARRMRDEIGQIPYGSSLTGLWGERDEEVAIEVSEAALRSFGLTFSDVANAVRGQSINISGGTVQTESGNIPIATRNLADSVEEFEDIIVRQTEDGAIIRVRDIGTVTDGFEEANFRLQLDGEQAILMWVQAPNDINIVEMSKSVLKWLDEKNTELAGTATLTIIDDTSKIYFSRMRTVSSNAIIGLFLVFVVLILFLRPIVAIWVSIGIGVSFIGAFIFLPAVGVSLNILSLFGLLLVIGIVVDDAIIVGESIHNRTENGESGLTAAVTGAQLVIKPVFFAVVTSIIAFAPFLFLQGGQAELTKQISWTITFALIFSLIESFFILPAHLSHMSAPNREGLFNRLQSFFADGLLSIAHNFYKPVLRLAIKFRYYTVALFSVFFMFSIALVSQGWIKQNFFPSIEGPFIDLDVTMTDGTAFNRTLQVYEIVEQAAMETKRELGQRNGEDVVQTVFIRANSTNVFSFMEVSESDKRGDLTTEEIANIWRENVGEIPDAEEIETSFTFNESGPELSFGIEGDSLDDVRLAMVDLQNYLRAQPGIFDIRNNLQSSTDELRISLLPGAERFGLTLAQISSQVRQAFFGEEVQRLPRGGEDVRVIVRLPKEDRSNLNTLSRIFIRTADGREVPLSAVATVEFAPSYKTIRRRDRSRSANVRASLAEGVERRDVMEAFRETFQFEWEQRHPEISLRQRGQAEEEDEFVQELNSLYIIALFVIYMLLAIAFTSYLQPLLIMSAIPFGFMGAMYGHMLLGIEFGLFTFFGVGAAAGVVINDNLVLIDYVNRLRSQGAGAVEALVRAGTGRFRPIILTSLTTFIGLVPIMLESSIDAQFLKPTVVAMAFGIFFAAFVTLLFVPAMYLVGADISRRYKWAWTGEKQPDVGRGASTDHEFGDGIPKPHNGQAEMQPVRRNPLIDPAE